MQAQRDHFMRGCLERGIPEKKATKVFEFIDYFAGYGFNKAHSTAYALLAYQTAYLKAHYPRHFMAALLTIESQSSDKVALYLAECRELNVPVLPPDINRSTFQFIVEPEGVRFGLGAVKGAGESAIRSLIDARVALHKNIGLSEQEFLSQIFSNIDCEGTGLSNAFAPAKAAASAGGRPS
jgi:DNA polymerase-3 subunit alpha